MQTITQFDLLLYIYGELDSEASNAIENQMKWDFELKEEILSMKEVKNNLDVCRPKVSASVVDSLIQYVRTTKY